MASLPVLVDGCKQGANSAVFSRSLLRLENERNVIVLSDSVINLFPLTGGEKKMGNEKEWMDGWIH